MNKLSQRFLREDTLSKAEQKVLQRFAETWRKRLCDFSWFMGALNEHIARRANAEDKVTGKYWESRFKSQTLLDEQAILACSVYCDLNPIRAQMADTPETSDYISIQNRIEAVKEGKIADKLLRFLRSEIKQQEVGLPCALKDYINRLNTRPARWVESSEKTSEAPLPLANRRSTNA